MVLHVPSVHSIKFLAYVLVFVSAHASAVAHKCAEGVIMVHLLDVAVTVHHETVAAKMVLHIEMHDYAVFFIHTCVAAVEEDGGKPVVVVDEIGTVIVIALKRSGHGRHHTVCLDIQFYFILKNIWFVGHWP